jgi:hypothetical protein
VDAAVDYELLIGVLQNAEHTLRKNHTEEPDDVRSKLHEAADRIADASRILNEANVLVGQHASAD